MYKEYFVSVTFLGGVQEECNKMSREKWQLVTAYASANRSDCCGCQKESAVLIFGR